MGTRRSDVCVRCFKQKEIAAHGLCYACYRQAQRSAGAKPWATTARSQDRNHDMATIMEHYKSRGPVENAIEDWRVCLHEAGHAVTAEHCGFLINHATVVSDKNSLGHVYYQHFGLHPERRIQVDVAGCTAEGLFQNVKKSEFYQEAKYYHWESSDFESVVHAVRDERFERRAKTQREGHGRGRYQARCRPARRRATKADRVAAWELWKSTAKALRRLWKQDPTYLRQIFAVAKELSLKRKLSGDEVRRAMAAAG